MKKLLPFIALFLALYLTACQREASLPSEDHGTEGNDSTPAGLLIKTVSRWSDNGTPAADSTVIEYTYNSAGKLIAQQSPGEEPLRYYRDALQRITKMAYIASPGDTGYTKVFYAGPSSMQVAYTVDGRTSTPTLSDSIVYTYMGGHVRYIYLYVNNSGQMEFSGFQKWEFDTQGNATRLDNYTSDSTYNIGYTFEYDNKTNPYYSPGDDVRLHAEWGYACSPNNIVKQNNEYEFGTIRDYVSFDYVYNSNNTPVIWLYGGTSIGNRTQTMHFYYK